MKESGGVYSSTSGSFKSKRLRRKPDQHFSSYISFGFSMTIFLAIVVVVYGILILYFVLVIFRGNNPLRIDDRLPDNNTNDHSLHQMQIKQPLTEKMKNAFDKFRHKVSDNQFINQVQQEINHLRKVRTVNSTASTVDHVLPQMDAPKDTKSRPGFIVLGMHRSGTSMLSGLLVTGMGYFVGEPLIGGAFDNEKGFFELIPVVLQNDEFLYSQHIDWSYNVYHYDYKKGLELANTNLDNARMLYTIHNRKA